MTSFGYSREGDLSLEEAIYEAALYSGRWPFVLEHIGRYAGAAGGLLFNLSDVERRWVCSSSLTKVSEALDGGWAIHGTEIQSRLESNVNLGRFIGRPLFENSSHRVGHTAWAAIATSESDRTAIYFERSPGTGPFLPRDRARLNALLPHLSRALMISRHLVVEQESSALAAFASVGLPAIALARDGELLDFNRQSVSELRRWTRAGDPKVVLKDPVATTRLGAALESMMEDHRRVFIPLRDAAHHVRCVLHLFPRPNDRDTLFRLAAAIGVFAQVRPSTGADVALVQEIFDLPPSEASVAARIARGQTVEEIASTDKRSNLTVRNQLKSVLAKLGCSRQLELTRLIGDLIPFDVGDRLNPDTRN